RRYSAAIQHTTDEVATRAPCRRWKSRGGGDYSGRVVQRRVGRPGPPRLVRMPEKVATAAIEPIYGPRAENPHPLGHALRRSPNRYRIDERAYRVVIEVIDHRGDIYRPR
ncbi:MAG: type II toxin-antitoxin system RelE family toxin, partial [Egibacteraceae bacterium]